MGIGLAAAGCSGAETPTPTPTPAPIDFAREELLCGFQPVADAAAYAGDVHPLVIPGWGYDFAPQPELLAGQPVASTQLVGCRRATLVKSDILCRYGQVAGGYATGRYLGRVRVTIWVEAVATGDMVGLTTLDGPEPTEADCPSSISSDETGLLAGPTLPVDELKSYLLPFVTGAPRQPIAPPATLEVTLTSLPDRLSTWGSGGTIEARTSFGARCTLAIAQEAPGATPRTLQIQYMNGVSFFGPIAGPDGAVSFDWKWTDQTYPLSPVQWEVGPATATVTCTRNGVSASATGTFAFYDSAATP